jgi:hypothetical protein
LENFLLKPKKNTMIIDNILNTNPGNPAELINKTLSIVATIIANIPDGAPAISVKMNMGTSEISNFKNGTNGTTGIFIKKSNTNDIVQNTQLCTKFEINMPEYLILLYRSIFDQPSAFSYTKYLFCIVATLFLRTVFYNYLP